MERVNIYPQTISKFFFFFFDLRGKNINESIVLKSSPAGRLETWPTWSRVEEKIGEGKTRRDPTRPGQKLDCNPLTFVFLLKRRRFD